MSEPEHQGSVGELVRRNPHEPTKDSHKRISLMAACGLSQDECCQVMDISRGEFDFYYTEDFKLGAMEATLGVGGAMLKTAMDTSHQQWFQAASFWLRARSGWRDIRAVEQTTKDLPEEQKQKLIDQLMDRLTLSKTKEAVSK